MSRPKIDPLVVLLWILALFLCLPMMLILGAALWVMAYELVTMQL